MKHFQPFLFVLLLCLIQACGTDKSDPVQPDFLKPGDKVALIAPAYPVPDSLVKVCCERLAECGLEPVVSKNALEIYPDYPGIGGSRYAGTAAQRTEDFKWALENKDIKAIICLTGGYGSIHVLPDTDPALLRDNPKWLVGCSDITSLLMAEVGCGVQSLHGAMGYAIAEKGFEAEDTGGVLEILFGRMPEYDLPADTLNIAGKAEGILVGGNMTNIVPLLGTDFDGFEGHDCILFIEETGESMHCIERQLSAILLHHRDCIKGVIVGDFTHCGDEFAYPSNQAMVADALKGLGIPVCFGFPACHGKRNLPLPEGAKTTMTVSETGTSLRFE